MMVPIEGPALPHKLVSKFLCRSISSRAIASASSCRHFETATGVVSGLSTSNVITSFTAAPGVLWGRPSGAPVRFLRRFYLMPRMSCADDTVTAAVSLAASSSDDGLFAVVIG